MPLCPKCEIPMDLRLAKKGRNAGKEFWGCTNFPKCRETLPYEPKPKVNTNYEIGQFVHVRGQGFGKVTDVQTLLKLLYVDFFHTPSDDDETSFSYEEYKIGDKRVILLNPEPGTTCYIQKESDWLCGKIVEFSSDGRTVEVSLENANKSQVFSIEEVQVLCRDALRDPIEYLRSNIGDHDPKYALNRSRFVESSLKLRAAIRGLRGLCASRIELHPHQIEIVNRVVRDPVNRFLLADEVGLGKTIETGSILKQLLMDDPKMKIELLLPEPLIEQWKFELQTKFDISEDTFEGLKFSPQGDGWRHTGSNFLVIDEAHHLTANAFSANQSERNKYEFLEKAALEVDGLLLLSATPVLHNEEAFLGMLHLLDPQLYELKDLEDFKERVQNRTDLARRFTNFTHQTSPNTLKNSIDVFKRSFPKDDKLDQLLMQIEESLDSPTKLKKAISLTRVHITESYKLHRRVLRTRRDSPLAKNFPVRGRQRAKKLPYKSELTNELSQIVETWNDCMDRRNEEFDAFAKQIHSGILERLSMPPIVLKGFIQTLVNQDLNSVNSLSSLEKEAITQFAITPEEKSILREMLETIENYSSDEWLPSVFNDIRDKVPENTVVYCSDAQVVNELKEYFETNAPEVEIATCLEDSSHQNDSEIERFRKKEASYLFCDRSGEEGKNFQFAAAILHVGIPWDPLRIEQRIGRVDRYSTDPAVDSYISYPSYNITETWLDVLTDGYEVFTRSIATLQHALTDTQNNFIESFLQFGTTKVTDYTTELREKLQEEREEILSIEYMEANEIESRITKSIFDDLIILESSEEFIKEPFLKWVLEDGMGLSLEEDADNPTLNKLSESKTFEPNTSEERFINRLENNANYQNYPWFTIDRSESLGLPQGALLRPGVFLFDELLKCALNSEQAQTYCFGRTRLDEEETFAVVLTYHLDAADRKVAEMFEKEYLHDSDRQTIRTLLRNMDDFLPPTSFKITIGETHKKLKKDIRDSVLLPFSSQDSLIDKKDIRNRFESLGHDWDDWFSELSSNVMTLVMEEESFISHKNQGKERATDFFEESIQQLQLRIEAEKYLKYKNKFEEELSDLVSSKEAVLTTLENIEPTLDQIGLIFLVDDTHE